MTDPNYTHIALIVDASGSMSRIAADMNGAIATYLAEQGALPGRLLVDAWTFDHTVQHKFVNADWTEPLLRELVTPGGMTALHDGIGVGVSSLGYRLARMSEAERPGKVIVVVVTDGGENSSKEYTAEKVKDLVTQQHEVYGWEFLYLGANDKNIFATSAGLGFARDTTLSYSTNDASIGSAYAAVSAVTTSMRTHDGGKGARFTDAEREAAK